MVLTVSRLVLSFVLAVLATAISAAAIVAMGVPFPPLLGWPVWISWWIALDAFMRRFG